MTSRPTLAMHPTYEWSTLSIAILAPIVTIILLLGVIGNVLVVVVLWKQRQSRRITGSYFLVSLAIVDVGASANLIFMLSTMVSRGKWIFGEHLCELNGFFTVFCGSTSLLTLCAISVNRYVKIVKGGMYKQIYTRSNTFKILAVTWLIPFALSLAPIIGWSAHEYQVGKCVCHFFFSRSASYTVTFSTIIVVIPFNIILFCYWKIYKIIKAHRTVIGNMRRSQPTVNVEDIKIATTLFIVIVVFIICYIPASIVNIVEMVRPAFTIPPLLDVLSFILVVSNHANNPLIYNAMNRSFRQAFREVLHLQPCGASGAANVSGARYPGPRMRNVETTGEVAVTPPSNVQLHRHSGIVHREKYIPVVLEESDSFVRLSLNTSSC